MKTLSIVGSQWGDEGKGKITDLMAEQAKYVVRYQGGNNAGHTIEFDNQKYSLHLIPSGVFNEQAEVVIAQGVVLNPRILMKELAMIKENGFDIKLHISDRANIIFPFHEELDAYYEDMKKDMKIGTTKKGIGPSYSDKINRIGVRVCELLDEEIFAQKLKYLVDNANKQLASDKFESFDYQEIYDEYIKYIPVIKQYVCDTSYLIDQAIKNNEMVLFEGAQGVMLDIEHGTYPYVTSSSPSTSSIPINVGIAPSYINNSLGIMKAYTSRVGEGPFPTELFGEVADSVIKEGHEYGTTTKRKRRVGWLDLVQMKHAIRVSGITQIAIMLLDVLSILDEVKVGIGYQIAGEEILTIPALEKTYSKVDPVYKTFKGWKCDISNCTTYEELPEEAKTYIEFIEKELDLDINVISIGPDRTQTIIRKELV